MLSSATLAADARSAVDAMASHYAIINSALRIPVIWDARYVDALGVGTVGPAIRFASLDWPDPAQGDVVDVEGEPARYSVTTIEPDGTGTIVCRLHRT